MKARLCLQDGKSYEGFTSKGYKNAIQGEIVFFTGMTGYQEVLTDPSYRGQIVVFTYPLIGNYGINLEDAESKEVQVNGVVMFHCAGVASHYQSVQSLGDYLDERGVPFLTGVDTREVTKEIRTGGTRQAILTHNDDYEFLPPESHQIDQVKGAKIKTHGEGLIHIGLIDFGWKKSILQKLLEYDVRVSVIPYSEITQVDDLKLDAVVLSNGPGDPKDVSNKLPAIKKMLDVYPSFGICMGHQVIALAYGADTIKLAFGHRGANHPVKDVVTGKVFLSSQNHNYVVDEASLIETPLAKRFYNVNDGSIEGLMHETKRIMSVQFHPEANPGPEDAEWLFDDFLKLVKKKEVKAYV